MIVKVYRSQHPIKDDSVIICDETQLFFKETHDPAEVAEFIKNMGSASCMYFYASVGADGKLVLHNQAPTQNW